MKALPLPDAEVLCEMLSYNKRTGALRWLVQASPRVKIGAIAGSPQRGTGYVQISVNGGRYLAHRVIWKMVTGCEPDGEIDHIDLDPSNNRFSNLRRASRSENKANNKRSTANRSGFKGACFKYGRWEASIKVNGRSLYLGRHDNPKLAHLAYRKAAIHHFGDFARFK